jgi:hypothetical protein
VIAIGNARARRYTRVRDVRGVGGEFPVYAVDGQGNAQAMGTLYAVAIDQFLWRPVSGREQMYRSLPWFVDDLRPDGFVGRSFVRRLHQELELPARSADWNDDHVLTALARRGEDTMGNLVIGRESIERYFRMVRDLPAPVREDEIAATYPRLAQMAMDGQPVGSSAGGEQPKFTAVIKRAGEVRNVLVKFSPPVDTTEGRRWADLLFCEHHALQETARAGIPAAESTIVEAGGRVFLEVLRFDRTGLVGRLPIISLRAVDNEFYGFQDNWINAAGRMAADGRLSDRDAASLRWLSVFGSLIGNTDQHFGNVSLVMVEGSKRYVLAPAYDMLPMVYRPMDGAAPIRPFTPPAVIPGAPQEWSSVLESAVEFWGRAIADLRIAEEFRMLCLENQTIMQSLSTGPRLIA